jgi:GT2 family glycosyltransferase
MSEAPVVVAVPNWNGGALTLECLRSLSRSVPPVEVVVVDNGSVDGSVAAIRAAHPDVHLLELGENQGFVGAANAGLALARQRGAELCLVFNNDAVVEENTIALLAEALRREPAAVAAGPTIYYADRPRVVWSAGGSIDWRRGKTSMLGIDETDEGQFGSDPRPVPFVTGCALLIRVAAVASAGDLDPRFFAYYEEVEWCVRCTRRGGRILHVPQAHAWHRISAAEREASPLVHYYMTRNRLLFLRSCGAPLSAWLRTLLVDDLRTLASWSLRPKWRGKRAQRDAMLRALLDFGRGRFGRAPLAGA